MSEQRIKLHSAEWFRARVDEAREQFSKWPEWMQETSTVATATFPQALEQEQKDE